MTGERGFSTRAVHGATPAIEQETPSVPLYQTSTFRFPNSEAYAETISFRAPGYTYTRGYGNPTVAAFERQMAALEGTETAFGFASGMAGIHTVLTAHAGAGDRVVMSTELYGGTFGLATTVLPRNGVSVTFVDPHDLDAVRAALPGASLFHVETIANPNASVADLEALGAACREAGVPASVDNTFASPYLCAPATYGFDYVCHSATKYVGGHHDLIAGVVCTAEDGRARLRDVAIETGGTMAPFEAWLCLRGLMTLSLRMERHSANAMALAGMLEGHDKIERVSYPGLASHPQHGIAVRQFVRGHGGMIALEVAGGVEGGRRFCDALELAWVATSLGGTHTLVGHAASTTHRQMDPVARRNAGIADGLVRMSVGIEDLDDIVDDVEQALEKV
ncbi:MAG: aminotransferase class I/II-fold pyridoxal phosphate-dependent enzyme [Actinomycetota bacterium]|nr:aminotransferase class I/II-fold pyridoxal phosphate-dependent enzyme [Actinomycetota bacterium]MDH5223407.1 aminotransferase class I/II-fold pyridoxal phosphate-dependent enzyme [Actinomycetota bacterium]MDH5312279.1 aminotransferase class I/II-fold pyridoxal phosphate-dependent enzyme [Actinomycetota bacterium]